MKLLIYIGRSSRSRMGIHPKSKLVIEKSLDYITSLHLDFYSSLAKAS